MNLVKCSAWPSVVKCMTLKLEARGLSLTRSIGCFIFHGIVLGQDTSKPWPATRANIIKGAVAEIGLKYCRNQSKISVNYLTDYPIHPSIHPSIYPSIEQSINQVIKYLKSFPRRPYKHKVITVTF